MLHALAQQDRKIKVAASFLMLLYAINGLASHAAVFVPNGDSVAKALVPIVPDNRRLPLVRNDIDEIAKVARYVDGLVATMPGEASIYVLASSTVFSSAQLRMLEVSTGHPFASAGGILVTSGIDKRDGFPRGLLNADLVLLTDPVQIHRRAEDQQVIEIPAEFMLSGTGIGAAFEKLQAAFELDEGVTVSVYRRTRENSQAEIEQLSERLRKLYPDRPGIYQ